MDEVYKILIEKFQVSKLDILMNRSLEISNQEKEEYLRILSRRKKHEPLEYILQKAYFMGMPFYVNQNVLIPRFDTERSVEILVDYLEKESYHSMLEIGVGSGCVSVYLAHKFPQSTFLGVDISEEALEVANKNKTDYKALNLDLFQSDLFENVHGTFNVIYSNPPYIPTSDMEDLEPSVLEYEPQMALDGGLDGLVFYKEIASKGKKYLDDNGVLVFEIGIHQLEEIKAILEKEGFENVSYSLDYQGIPRVVWGEWRGECYV
nr:peptide chain release factor N(5)-glutamine methyltransferase [Peptoniphilus sp. KCTC 25270]